MAYFLQFLDFARLGSVGDHFTISPAGASLALFGPHSPPSISSPQPRPGSATGTRHQEKQRPELAEHGFLHHAPLKPRPPGFPAHSTTTPSWHELCASSVF